ncbi:MAG: PAS domain S-box protein, partial [Gammaproteobacteria bacterium]|nr:PAS domain S-box protein [Gammaproteobacteria bacterium]
MAGEPIDMPGTGFWHYLHDLDRFSLSPGLRARFSGAAWTSDSIPLAAWLDRVEAADRARVRAELTQPHTDCDVFTLEYRVGADDGASPRLRFEGWVAERDPGGQPLRTQGMVFDTTRAPRQGPDGGTVAGLGFPAARQREATLRQVDDQRRQLMNQSNDGILIHDAECRVIEANQRHADMLGLELRELPGMAPWDWDTALSESEIRELFAATRAAGRTFETRHRRKDGTSYPAEVSLSGTLIEGRHAYLTVARDISERKESEHLLRAQSE